MHINNSWHCLVYNLWVVNVHFESNAAHVAIGDVTFGSAQFGGVWRLQVQFASFPCGCGRLCGRRFSVAPTAGHHWQKQDNKECKYNELFSFHLVCPFPVSEVDARLTYSQLCWLSTRAGYRPSTEVPLIMDRVAAQ